MIRTVGVIGGGVVGGGDWKIVRNSRSRSREVWPGNWKDSRSGGGGGGGGGGGELEEWEGS